MDNSMYVRLVFMFLAIVVQVCVCVVLVGMLWRSSFRLPGVYWVLAAMCLMAVRCVAGFFNISTGQQWVFAYMDRELPLFVSICLLVALLRYYFHVGAPIERKLREETDA